jgi:predicted TIM-barrel enzyme
LAAANSAGLDFIRTEGFVFAHVADEGLIESDAGELLRYRKQIDGENILIFTDIKKKQKTF